MSVEFRPAVRANVPLLIGLAGSTGSGKTYSALQLATGLAGGQRFALIDTESGRALHYADEFQFDHARLDPPFRPNAYSDAIHAADGHGYPVIVVDSTSHEHAGEGGLLDMHEEELDAKAGDDPRRREAMKMAAWIRPKMEHKRFVSRLLQLRSHLILCFRAEEKIEIAKEGGRTVVRPKQSLTGRDGWIPICEPRLPYELTVFCLLTADQPGVPKPIKLPEQLQPFIPLDAPLTRDAGRRLADWAAGAGQVEESLAADLLALAEQLGKASETAAAIDRHRGDARWLQAQIGNAQRALAARVEEPVEEPLFAEAARDEG